MVIDMNDARLETIEQIREFLAGTTDVLSARRPTNPASRHKLPEQCDGEDLRQRSAGDWGDDSVRIRRARTDLSLERLAHVVDHRRPFVELFLAEQAHRRVPARARALHPPAPA